MEQKFGSKQMQVKGMSTEKGKKGHKKMGVWSSKFTDWIIMSVMESFYKQGLIGKDVDTTISLELEKNK